MGNIRIYTGPPLSMKIEIGVLEKSWFLLRNSPRPLQQRSVAPRRAASHDGAATPHAILVVGCWLLWLLPRCHSLLSLHHGSFFFVLPLIGRQKNRGWHSQSRSIIAFVHNRGAVRLSLYSTLRCIFQIPFPRLFYRHVLKTPRILVLHFASTNRSLRWP